ncbi:hypothetical protein [Halomonas saccharevitans]|uniref:Uncharacterized protein n=1 Tax=Halomonas saccharevitans TaxID=416872 RepID=A0A1I6YPW2_9GAMM|nr:hypothetical protein [Halomonas saccharevitans]SFT52526.1 hypothetical protein SAMN04487956_106111 [Halomonas saccharevitans]
MKTTLMTATLMLAALPLAAQADPATDKALQLNQEPLSSVERSAFAGAPVDLERLDGASDAMAQARLRLRSQQAAMTDFAANGDAYRLAREATS